VKACRVRHPARFVLVGSGNPEEGELRPQLIDRFGLAVDVRTPTDLATRVQVVKRRDAFERDPAAFIAHWKKDEDKTRRRIVAARERLARCRCPTARWNARRSCAWRSAPTACVASSR
jgi:magnesium chelatase subunit I